MKLDIDAIEVEDFKSFHAKTVLDLRAYGNGLHFMKGSNKKEPRLASNGAGKSTLLVDAPSWCFFGKTPRGLKGTDVRPWHGGKKTRVYIHVRIDGKKHVIARTLNPSLLAFDGKEIGQEDLERKLGLNFATFTNCVVMGQSVDLFFDMEPKKKMDLFVDALALDKWDARAGAASQRVRNLELKKAGYEGELTAFEEQVENYTRLLANAEQSAKEWDDEHSKRFQDAGKEVKRLEKALAGLKEAHGKVDLEFEAAETELRQYRRDITTQEEALLAADRIEQEKKSDYERTERDYEAVIDELKEQGDTCKTCGQSLKGTALEKHRKALAKKKDELGVLLERQGAALDKAMKVGDTCKEQVDATRARIREYDAKATECQDKLDALQKGVITAEAELRAARANANREQDEVNPHKESVRKLKEEIKRTRDDLEDCTADIRATESKIARTKFWVKGFKDVRLFILEEVLHEFEFATNAMLDDAGLVGWEVSYEVERETTSGKTTRGLSIFINSPDSNGRVKWESWSGGEGQRLRLVGAFALAEVLLNHAGVTTSFEVVDEPTQHMSLPGVRDLCGYLAERAERLARQVWLVDHVAIESREFASVTTVVRDDKGSRLLSEG